MKLNQVNRPCPPFRLLPAGAVLAAAGVLALAIAVALLVGLSKTDQLPVALSTAVACLLIALIAQVPVSWLSAKSIEGAALGFVVGMVSRIGLTLMAALGVSGALEVNALTSALWTSSWYVLLLAVEVILLCRYFATRQLTIADTGSAGC